MELATSDDADEASTLVASQEPTSQPQLTLRATLVGLLIGSALCFTNMYFGLQTGWVTMGSIQSSLIGFAICSGFRGGGTFGPLENVALQTVAVATATMPLAAGFVGVIPALALLDPPVRLSFLEQIAWCTALAFFGIAFAVPLRKQVIIKEKLPFPSGTATYKLIEVLHSHRPQYLPDADSEMASRWWALKVSFAASFSTTLVRFFVPPLTNLHFGSWLGLPVLTAWHWTLRPALAYVITLLSRSILMSSQVGQGMIMGMRPALSMFGGAVVGWGLLGPLASVKGWAPGPITSWHDGAQGTRTSTARSGSAYSLSPRRLALMACHWSDAMRINRVTCTHLLLPYSTCLREPGDRPPRPP